MEANAAPPPSITGKRTIHTTRRAPDRRASVMLGRRRRRHTETGARQRSQREVELHLHERERRRTGVAHHDGVGDVEQLNPGGGLTRGEDEEPL